MSGDMLFKIYTAVKILGEADIRKLIEVTETHERTLYRYLSILVGAGYLGRERKGVKVYYYVKKPATRSELEALYSRGAVGQDEALPYQLAMKVQAIIKRYKLDADLIGSAKIHLSVPRHQRLTHDVDAVVVREHARMLANLLEDALHLNLVKAGGIHADYQFEDVASGVRVDLMVDGFREKGRMVWNLSPILRERHKLTLEHAVVAKLVRRGFREDADSYDVAVALPHINVERFVKVLAEACGQTPEFRDRVSRHLEIVEKYVAKAFPREDAEIYIKILKAVKEKVGKAKASVELESVEH